MAPPPTLPNASSKFCHIPSQLARKNLTWDPFSASGDDNLQATHIATSRVKRDLLSLYNEPPPGLFVIADEADMMLIHAIIMGTVDTPYEGGFFYLVLKCPPDYPIRPPRVRLMTTGAGSVRFNPNLYKNGKVCLSILGTWDGPAWSPAQQISSLLISIQSLLTENPYHNEPGFEKERNPGDVKRYNEVIEHETLRVAVCGMLENDCMLNLPTSLRQIMEKTFLQYYDHYVTVANKNCHMDGTQMQDPFRDDRGKFQYKALLIRLEKLREKLTEKHGNVDSPMHDNSFYPSLVGVEESTDDTHDELYEGELSDDSKTSEDGVDS